MKYNEIKELLIEFSIYCNKTELSESDDKITDHSVKYFMKDLEKKNEVKDAEKLTIGQLDDLMNSIEDHTPLWNYYLLLKRKLKEAQK